MPDQVQTGDRKSYLNQSNLQTLQKMSQILVPKSGASSVSSMLTRNNFSIPSIRIGASLNNAAARGDNIVGNNALGTPKTLFTPTSK
jgi:hypothetical protein